MKRILRNLAIPVLLLTMMGCTQDILEDINENKNDPTDIPASLLLPDAITKTAFSTTGTDFTFYASVYIEHNVGTFNQMYNAEIRSGDPSASTTYNTPWTTTYETLRNLRTIIKKTSEGGQEPNHYHALGIAQVLTAYNIAILTDCMGDVPFTEALQPGVIFQPKLDKQEDIYEQIFTLLDDAITNLGKETTYPAIGQLDMMFHGDISKWRMFAYGLKARYTTRLCLRNGGKWNDVIEFANNSFKSPAQQAQYNYDGNSAVSPYCAFLDNRDYFGASKSLHEKLIEFNDPRDEVYFIPYPGEDELRFAPNGTTEEVTGYYGLSGLTLPDAPTYLLSYHEVEFIKAEAYSRLGDNIAASNSLHNALKAAFEKVGLTSEDADNYFENEVTPRFETNPLKEIMIQKYLSFYEEESLEAYNDFRRLKALGENFITLSNPYNNNRFPLRFTYGADDVTTNPNIAQVFGNGQYVYTENVWWAGGTK